MKKPAPTFGVLRDAMRQTGFDFLLAEMKIANTMLDITVHAPDQVTVSRRRAAAVDARNEIARGASNDLFTDVQREELLTALAQIDARLDETS